MQLSPAQIAEVCHEANRTYCQIRGDSSHQAWASAPDSLKAGTIAGVETAIGLGAGATPEAMHRKWMDWKVLNGWTFGDVKDNEKKTHPNIRPYKELPHDERLKDLLFIRIVKTLAG